MIQSKSDKSFRILHTTFLFLIISIYCPRTAQANSAWPALTYAVGYWSLYPIAAGLLIEYLFIRRITQFSVSKSILADLCMNACSAVAGMFLISALGPVSDFMLAGLDGSNTYVSAFQRHAYGTPVSIFILSVLINAVIEALALSRFYKIRIEGKYFVALILVNAVSVAIAFATVLTFPTYRHFF